MEDHFEQFHQKLATNNYLSVCRFCLVPGTMIKVLPPEQLAASKIPSLFKALTDSDMIITPNHPESFCDTCIKELEAAVNIREHFKNIEGFWNQFLNDLIEPIEMKEEIDDIPNAAPIFIETIPMVVDTVEMPKEQIQIAIESMHHQHHHQHHHHQHERKDITTKPDEKRQISIEYVDKDGMSADKRPKKRQKANVAAASTSTSTALNMCDVCGITFTKKTDLNKHVNEYHIKSEMENADIKVASNLLPSIEQPVITVSALSPIPQSAKKALKKKLNCNECNETFTLKRLLVLHLKKHITKKCETCNIEFKSMSSRDEHMKSKHRNPIPHTETLNKCYKCDRIFLKIENLFLHHRKKHFFDSKIECYLCKEEFSKTSLLQLHMVRKHQTPDTDLPSWTIGSLCHICGVMIKYKNFKRHLQTTHAGGKLGKMYKIPESEIQTLTCLFCSYASRYKNALKMHIKTKHPDEYTTTMRSAEAKYAAYRTIPSAPKCPICQEPFDNAKDLRIHKQTHKNAECNICKKRFVCKDNLKLHMKQHSSKERAWKCEICGASFIFQTHLRDHHNRKHTTNRPFKCTLCDKSFVQRFELRSHIGIAHWKMKPYECEHCPKTFSTASGLKHHQPSHTGVYYHTCPICAKGFVNNRELDEHIGRHRAETTLEWEITNLP